MSEKFTILIQGPLNNVSLKNVENYKKFGNVVISHWDEKKSVIQEKFAILNDFKNDPKVKIVSAPLPEREEKVGILKDSTFYWAVESCYHGFEACESEYVIKTRSDEYFSDLQPMIDQVLKDKGNVFVCGNIFVKSNLECPMHIGDHIFSLKTKTAQHMYRHLMDMYNGRINILPWAEQGPSAAEQIVAYSFLRQMGLRAVDSSWMHVVDINSLGQYEVRWAFKDETWNSNDKKFINPHEIQNQDDYIRSYN